MPEEPGGDGLDVVLVEVLAAGVDPFVEPPGIGVGRHRGMVARSGGGRGQVLTTRPLVPM
jgi:hypothetical protein